MPGERARGAADAVDHRVGYDRIAGLGRSVSKGDVIGRVFARDDVMAEAASKALLAALSIGDTAPITGPVVADVVSATD